MKFINYKNKHSDLIVNVQNILLDNNKTNEVLTNIVNLCGRHFKVSRFIIGIFDENINEYIFQYTYENQKTKKLNLHPMTMPGKGNNAGLELLLDNKIYHCNDTKKTNIFKNLIPYFNKYSIFSTIFTGIWCNNNWYGKIGMHECFTSRNWDCDDIKTLQNISKILSLYLELDHSRDIISNQDEKITHLKNNLKNVLSNNNLLKISKNEQNKKKDKLEKLVSSAENKVLAYVVEGYTNSEIAKKLNLSKRTIETHITNMLSKIDVKNRVQLTRFVMDCNAIF